MSSNRKKNRTLRNRQGDLWAWYKNRNICLFLPIQKTSFFTFSSNSPVSSQNSKPKYVHSIGVNKPDILRPMSSKLMKEEYPKKSVTDGQIKNNVLFRSCDDIIEPNEIKLRPCVPLCGRSFLAKRFFRSVHPFQRYCLKTVSSAHRPTL